MARLDLLEEAAFEYLLRARLSSGRACGVCSKLSLKCFWLRSSDDPGVVGHAVRGRART
jgi:hypothetical protein